MIYKDKDKDDLQRQRHPKDVPKMDALREDVKDAESKDKDAKDVLDVFLMKSWFVRERMLKKLSKKELSC
jgi:hypothetical protein